MSEARRSRNEKQERAYFVVYARREQTDRKLWLMRYWQPCGYERKKTPEGLIALSVAALRNLLSKLMEKMGEAIEQILHWPYWRRQYCAQQYHYRRRDNPLNTNQLQL
ncbi:hypothetical protein [Xenorhabdus mauleonii]|uniref:hypothetical protein n=1 Tax=Xenorhabdus mauleonii TaxID=351675 RepID=UPI000B80FB57|nr:hypothetical protein [Xenorhabdus mauleonii]